MRRLCRTNEIMVRFCNSVCHPNSVNDAESIESCNPPEDCSRPISVKWPRARICLALLMHDRIYLTVAHFSEGTTRGSTIGWSALSTAMKASPVPASPLAMSAQTAPVQG